MHTIKLNIHDSIYDKLMGLLDILPKDKIEVFENDTFPTISLEEAKHKVNRAINNVDNNEGISLDAAFDSILKS
ncbi:MAG: hypothetical protein U9N52_10130 [Campylobacterota bacterium]|nr:hypothetical protein [Campylobacterota bacterium]